MLEPRTLGNTLRAPGEVRQNAYATARVTPRIDAQVLTRHARLGDKVQTRQPLVTLSSVDMAEAQGDFVVAEREWQRLTKLKDQFVSDTEYLAASVAPQKALSSVLAYGMTQEQAEALIAVSEKADGIFELLAPAGGTVVRDDFVLGEPVLALPEAAVLRGHDGGWQVFVAESEDTFIPVEIQVLRTDGGMAVIKGIPAGTKVVTRGAFFLQSELAKGSFDPHNH